MGQDIMDIWSLSHFLGGVFYRLVVFPNNWIVSFTLSLTIHLIGELIERKIHPVTGAKETSVNNSSDLMFFIIGWWLGSFVNDYIPPYSKPYISSPRSWILVFTVLVTIKEFFREIVIVDRKSILGKTLY